MHPFFFWKAGSNSTILLFANDGKIFKFNIFLEDNIILQNNLIAFNEWCISNDLSLNIDQCLVVSYSKKHNSYNFNYCMYDISFLDFFLMKDLGILFYSKLLFKS